MDGLIPQVACQAQWAIASLLNAMTVQAPVAIKCPKMCSVNPQLMLSLQMESGWFRWPPISPSP